MALAQGRQAGRLAKQLLQDCDHLTLLQAEGRVVAQMQIIYEWSDWYVFPQTGLAQAKCTGQPALTISLADQAQHQHVVDHVAFCRQRISPTRLLQDALRARSQGSTSRRSCRHPSLHSERQSCSTRDGELCLVQFPWGCSLSAL